MSCFRPIEGYVLPGGGITWSPPKAYVDLPKMKVACGQCVGCRIERSRQWSVRIMHEAAMAPASCFITLTYDDEHLPRPATLVKSHFQHFMMRVRKSLAPQRISYFMCGEYGSENWRPHYHAIIFGHDFSERVRRGGEFQPNMELGRRRECHASESLSKLWPLGFNAVGPVTEASARYVAAYCLKKVTGAKADEHYKRVDPTTGEVYWLLPEYAHMSTRPAIGKGWFEKFGSDVKRYDGVHVEGSQGNPPRYYDKLRRRSDQEELARAKRKRRIKALGHAEDQTPARLATREFVTSERTKLFGKRKI